MLSSFNYGDGAFPYAGLIADSNGNLYGTTSHGGVSCLDGQCAPFNFVSFNACLTLSECMNAQQC